MHTVLRQIILACLVAATSACSSTPDGVIEPDDMASLLADLNVAESVVDLNYRQWPDDSARMALKESVYMRHGVTAEQVDSSYMYYGNHLKQYQEIHDKAIALLQKRIDAMGQGEGAQGVGLAVAGDSVNVWPSSPWTVLTQLSPSHTIAFSLAADNHWEKGDWYTWSFKTLGGSPSLKLSMMVDYTDGTSEYTTSSMPAQEGQMTTLSLYTDTAREASRIYGTATYEVQSPRTAMRRSPLGDRVYIDSLSLIRRRLDPTVYFRRYSHREF